MAALVVRSFSARQDYQGVWHAMRAFTENRTKDTPDEIWLMEHHPVYTLGQAGQRMHLLDTGTVPVIVTDRGGQVTWHGPGQLMIYTLLDTRRLQLGARALVSMLEQVLVRLLAGLGVAAHARADAPGVYVGSGAQEAKLAALGLRIRKSGCYHGLALNLDCELGAFAGINPCGYAGMPVTRLYDLLTCPPTRADIESRLLDELAVALHYPDIQRIHCHD